MIDRHFIYFPVRELFADPAAIGLAHEEVNFVAGDGVSLHGWFVPGRSDVTLLWCHGNGGNISHRLENLLLVHNELGLNVFLFDYRGYGRSDGKPSEQGTYLDAEAALSFLDSRKDILPDRIIYFGSSLGGGVAVELAMLRSPYGLILESTFPSIRYMARLAFPVLPLYLFLQDTVRLRGEDRRGERAVADAARRQGRPGTNTGGQATLRCRQRSQGVPHHRWRRA